MMWRGKAEPLSCLLLLSCFSPEGPRFLIVSHSSVTVAARVCASIFLQLPSPSVQPCPFSTLHPLGNTRGECILARHRVWRNLPVITHAGLSLESKVLESPGPPCTKIWELYILYPLRGYSPTSEEFLGTFEQIKYFLTAW